MRVYVDGACFPNPGIGGWGVVAENGIELSGSEVDVTNNQMELRAIYEALKIIPSDRINVIFSDSQYSVHCITKWYSSWVKSPKVLKKKKNIEIISACHELYKTKNVNILWIPRDTHELNMRADELSKQSVKDKHFEINGFELETDFYESLRK